MDNIHYYDTQFLILRDWITEDDYKYELHKKNEDSVLYYLYSNPNAIKIIESTFYKLNRMWFHALCSNPNAVHIIEDNMDLLEDNKYLWIEVCKNPNAIHLIEKNLNKLNDECWQCLNMNENAMDILLKNEDKIFLEELCLNTNPKAITYIENNIDDLDFTCWQHLLGNKNATKIIKKALNDISVSNNMSGVCKILSDGSIDYLDLMTYTDFCSNENAIEMFKDKVCNLDYVSGYRLNKNKNMKIVQILKNNSNVIQLSVFVNNPNIVYFLENNPHKSKILKRYKHSLSKNPSIFSYNYKEIKEVKHDINKEFIEWVWKPTHQGKWKEWKL